MLNRIPSDVVEIVVVYSRSYKLYIELKGIVEKFNGKTVETRVRDKLTTKTYDYSSILYTYCLGKNICSREYGKPFYISTRAVSNGIFFDVYRITKTTDRTQLTITNIGERWDDDLYIGVQNSGFYIYRIGRNVFYSDGRREIFIRSDDDNQITKKNIDILKISTSK